MNRGSHLDWFGYGEILDDLIPVGFADVSTLEFHDWYVLSARFIDSSSIDGHDHELTPEAGFTIHAYAVKGEGLRWKVDWYEISTSSAGRRLHEAVVPGSKRNDPVRVAAVVAATEVDHCSLEDMDIPGGEQLRTRLDAIRLPVMTKPYLVLHANTVEVWMQTRYDDRVYMMLDYGRPDALPEYAPILTWLSDVRAILRQACTVETKDSRSADDRESGQPHHEESP